MVRQGIGHGALIAVVRGQVEDVLERVFQLGQHRVVRDGSLDEREPVRFRQVLLLCGEQVVHHRHVGRALVQKHFGQIGAHEPRAAHHQGSRVFYAFHSVFPSSTPRRWVKVCWMPNSL